MSGVKLDREGRFKARPTSWTMRTRDSGSVCVSIGYAILAQFDYDEETWSEWGADADDVYVYGDHYVIKKDGKPNNPMIEKLYDALGWDGNPDALLVAPPDVVVQVTVKADEYQGKTTYKVDWLDRGDAIPKKGGGANATPEDLVSVKQRFGSVLRAAFGAAKAKAPIVVASTPPAAAPAVATKPAREPRGPNAPTEEEARAATPVDPVNVLEGSDEAAKFDSDIPF